MFDLYDKLNIKEGTRERRKKGKFNKNSDENQNLPLPHDWQGLLSDPGNKAYLPKLLFCMPIDKTPEQQCVITTDGLEEGNDCPLQKVRCCYKFECYTSSSRYAFVFELQKYGIKFSCGLE